LVEMATGARSVAGGASSGAKATNPAIAAFADNIWVVPP
jgi:hypothetical protein